MKLTKMSQKRRQNEVFGSKERNRNDMNGGIKNSKKW